MANPDSMAADEVLRRQEVAKRLLEDPIMIEVFETADATLVKEWRAATNLEAREAVWAKITGLEEVQRLLRVIVSQGEYIQERLVQEAEAEVRRQHTRTLAQARHGLT